MAWLKKDTATTGEVLLIDLVEGWYIGLFGAITQTDVLEAVRAAAVGWNVIRVDWAKGFFGIGDTLRVYGQVKNTTLPTDVIRRQVAEAVNSFWTSGGSDAVVYVGNNAAEPFQPAGGSEWTGTIQIVAILILAIAVVWGISETRKLIK